MINQSFIIGVTGNIATGKSVIRRMLGNAGALTIDADHVAHRVLYPGSSAYQAVIKNFGAQILLKNGSISNKLLGAIVFNDPDRLEELESLVHPLVIDDIIARITQTNNPFVVVEAIKLLESGLSKYCDSIWVSHASFNHQLDRLQMTRGLSADEAKIRINAQPPQSEKLNLADVVISTETTFKDTWIRILKALSDTIISTKLDGLHINNLNGYSLASVARFPASLLESAWQNFTSSSKASLYERLGMSKVTALSTADQIQTLIVSDEWNFTSALELVAPLTFWNKNPGLIINALTQQAKINQSEVILIPREFSFGFTDQLLAEGFTNQEITQLVYPAWQQAAQRVSAYELSVWFKLLSQPFEVVRKVQN